MTRLTKSLLALASAASMAFTLPACASEQEVVAAPVAAELEKAQETEGPALWQVADEDTTIYLFGTVHALPKEVVWYRGKIADALGNSDILVTEVIMDAAGQAKMQQLVMSTAILPANENLRDMLSEEQRTEYEAALAKIGLPPQSFDRFEPWYAALMVSMLPLLQQGYDPNSGAEKVLENSARAGIPRGELETIESQMGLFDSLGTDAQIDYLMQTVAQVDEIKPLLDAMVAEWLEGDADALAEMMNQGMTDAELLEALLYKRNRAWAEWIDERLDEPGTVFVAVGAGHLAGDQSVQDALAARGIATARIQ
jgi:uncharacterized protein YbaP (TraB family)